MYEIFEKLLSAHNVTSYRVSKETGIPSSTFTDWKNGRSTPKNEKLQKIAEYFGVTIDYLMGIEKYVVEDIEPEYINIIREAKEMGFSPSDIRLALNLLEMAKKSGK